MEPDNKPVFVFSQPKAGTYLLANVLLELGYTGGHDGIMHISRGKYEVYPYPGTPGFYRARTDPNSVRTEMHWYEAINKVKKPKHFAVSHLPALLNHTRFFPFKIILLTRPIEEIKASLDRWDKFSGRGPSNHKKTLHNAVEVAKWTEKKFLMPKGTMFELEFADMKEQKTERIDALQKFLNLDPLQVSARVLIDALRKDSITKVS